MNIKADHSVLGLDARLGVQDLRCAMVMFENLIRWVDEADPDDLDVDLLVHYLKAVHAQFECGVAMVSQCLSEFEDRTD